MHTAGPGKQEDREYQAAEAALDAWNCRTDQHNRVLYLLREARATLEMWKDVMPAVSLCADIDAALAAPAAPQADIQAKLKDPVVVHRNMCHGTIAPITFDQLAHVLGDEAKREWLAKQSAPQSAYQCANCKAPLRSGYTCGVCGSDEAEESGTAAPQEQPSDKEIENIGYECGLRKSVEHWGVRYYFELGGNLFEFARALLSRYGAAPQAGMLGARIMNRDAIMIGYGLAALLALCLFPFIVSTL